MPDKIPILILAHSYPPVSHSGAERPRRFAKYLSRFGHPVEVLTSTQFARIPSEPGIHRIPQAETGVKALLHKAMKIVTIPMQRYDYGITWVVHSIPYAKRLLEKIGPCCVISTYPPLSVHITALALKRKYRIKWIADFRDPLRNPFRPALWAAQRADRYYEETILRLADLVLVNTDASTADLQERYPQYRDKIHLLWNGYDPEEDVHPLPVTPRATRLLAHIGTMYPGRHPNLLLESLERLTKRGIVKPGALQIFISDINTATMPNLELYERMVKEGAIVFGKERVPRSEALRITQEADLLLLLDLTPGPESHQVPAKVFDYVRAGRPILLFTSHNSPTEMIVQNCGIPNRIVYRDDTHERIDQMVSEFLQLPSECPEPSEWFKETFDGSRQAAQLAGLIDGLIEELIESP